MGFIDDTSNELLEKFGISGASERINLAQSTIVDGSIFQRFDGPLAPLEPSAVNYNVLTYPEDLGSNSQYKYAMRILIYKQVKEVAPLPIIPGNSFDRSLKASQAGRINSDIINARSVGAVGGALAAIGAVNVTKAVGGASKSPVASTVSNVASAVTGTAIDAAKAGAALFAASSVEGIGTNVTTEPISYINLYMPEGLNFVDRHDYDAVSVTDALGNLGALGTGTATEIAARIGQSASVAGISLLGQNITDLALYNSGYALNPQLQVLFKGSKNREFVFTFKFAPRNAREAQSVESIIRTLRFHAAPNYEGDFGTDAENRPTNSRYFIPPSQFEIEFLIMTKSTALFNDKLPRIAQCVLTNVDVNYAPSGQFSAFVDNQPVETQVQLTFTETVVLTKPDIAIGY